jgi:hypothetical protein
MGHITGSNAQTNWTLVNDTMATVSFLLPVSHEVYDTLHTTLYNCTVDSLLSLQMYYFDSAYFDSTEVLLQQVLAQNNNDTLRAIAQLILFATNSELLSIEDISSGLRSGLETGIDYLTLQSDVPTLGFMRYYLFDGKFIVFSISGSKEDIPRLTSYKSIFFNSIKFLLMKNILLITAIVPILFLGSCKKCKEMKHVDRAYLMTKYFDNYKPGAYWIYLNRDSTKKDSMWVDNYKTEYTGEAQFYCVFGDNVGFDLHNSFLENTHKLHVNIWFSSEDLLTTTFEAFNSNDELYTCFRAKNEGTSFYFNGDLPTFFSYNIWPSNTTYTFYEVVQDRNLLFAPGIGLIQYIPVNSTDTFSLTKFVQ